MFAVIALAITISAFIAVSVQPYNLVGDPWLARLQRRFRR